MVNPPILLSQDGSLSGFNMHPGSLVWGGVNEDGQELAKPFRVGGDLAISFEMMEQKRKMINDAFFVTLFRILVDNPQMTATEAMLRAQEKGQLMAPTGGRLQSEFCGSIIQREIEILSNAGELPPMPQEIMDAGGIAALDIEYTSPLNRAQRAEEGVAILRTIETAGVIAQFDPTIKDVFKGSDIMRELAQINGMRTSLLHSAEEMEEKDAAAAQQAQINQLLEAAPAAAGAAKNLAQAQAIAGASPTQISPVTLPQ